MINEICVYSSTSTDKKILMGFLRKLNNVYQFEYSSYVKENNVYVSISVAFPNHDKIYNSNKLFSIFANRLPNSKRADIDIILANYGLSQYDEFEILIKSGGKTPYDDIEFKKPLSTPKH